MKTFLKNLLKRFHVHQWEGTRYNGYFIEVESFCRCGAYRHHLWDDHRGEVILWRDGKHPNRDKIKKN